MAAVVCELVYLNRIENSNDLIFDIWRVIVCIQVIQCLSIIASCLFYMKPFVDSLETGFVQLGDSGGGRFQGLDTVRRIARGIHGENSVWVV